MPAPLHTGKKDPTYDKRDIRYADVRPSGLVMPTIPKPRGGFGMDFGSTGWLMLGNGPDDTVSPGFGGCGDCAWAGPGHEIMEAAKNSNRAIPAFSGKTIVDQYSEYSGYNFRTGENDNGSYVREVLKWRQDKGIVDNEGNAYKIGTYIALEPGNLTQIWEALYLFESVGIGIQFPDSAMDQFNLGKIWSVVPGAPQPNSGHYVPLVGHPSNNIWTCVTWGQRQTMTPQFLMKYCDEAWAYIDPERYSTVTGKTYEGYTSADLESYITQMAHGA